MAIYSAHGGRLTYRALEFLQAGTSSLVLHESRHNPFKNAKRLDKALSGGLAFSLIRR
jgi:hypothetical protein